MDASFDRAVLTRLPLAEAILTLARWTLGIELLNATYDENRGRCYTWRLTFADFVHILFDCLSRPWNSARAGLVNAKDDGRLPVSLKAFYDKLKHTPVAVSLAFFRATAERLRQVFPDQRSGCPSSLKRFTCLLLDGKVVKHVTRRLKALRLDRENAGKFLGPRTLVVANRWTGLVHDLVVDLDGEANEIKHIAEVLLRVRQTVQGSFLIVGDRAFGVFKICADILEQGGDFVLRKHGVTEFVPDPERPPLVSTDRFGRRVLQEWGWVVRGKETKRKPRPRIPVRQLTVQRDTSVLVLISSLLDPQDYPLDDLLDGYLSRWDIEGIFQQVTEVFHLRNLFSTSPCGMLMQLVLAFLMYNVVQVVKQFIAAEEERAVQSISSEMLFRDIQEELIAVTRVLPEATVVELIADLATPTAVAARLRELLKDCWCGRWQKANYHPRDPSQPVVPKPKKIHQKKSHDSVQRILAGSRQ